MIHRHFTTRTSSHRGLGLILLLLSAFAISAEAQRISLDALQRDGYGMVPLNRPHPNVLTVTAAIDGNKVTLIVDTGALVDGITLQSDQLRGGGGKTEEAKGHGTSSTGAKVPLRKAVANRVALGNAEISGVPLVVGNLKGLRSRGSMRSVAADGLLGAGFLRNCSGIIDLHNLRLYLRPPGKGHRVDIGPALRASGLSEAPLGENCLVDIQLNETPGKMVLDTGAYVATADLRFAYKAGASVGGSFVGSVDVAGVISETQIAKVKSFKIGGVPVSVPDLRLGKWPFYQSSGGQVVGYLGMDILGRNGTIIDFGQRKLYFYAAK